MNKTLIVPDVHGRPFWEKVLDVPDFNQVVFLGDYVDPYPAEFPELTRDELWEQTLSEFKRILGLKKLMPDKVVLLLGNHDIHYRNSDYACSRFSYEHCEELNNLYADNWDLLQLNYVLDGKYLFSHSAVTEEWLGDKLTIKDYINGEVELPKLMQCGPFRWGADRYSGPMWWDIRELNSTTLDPTYYQIFGHTQLREPIIKDNFACLDCRKVFQLENGRISELS